MTDANHIRTALERLRDELNARRERIRAHGRDGVPADFAEQAAARENDEVVAALATQVDAELRQVTAALARLERGDYGTCERCGAAIAPARLATLPYAAHCAACAD